MSLQEVSTIEVELKFRVDDLEVMRDRLISLGALPRVKELHQDTYFRHPCRDFAATREALRIRRVEVFGEIVGDPGASIRETRVTYKGPHLAGPVKARHELEWSLESSDPNGRNLQDLLVLLGFSAVTTVRKTRRSMTLCRSERDVTVAFDEVAEVGTYVEIEVMAQGENDVAAAQKMVLQLATELNLSEPEPRSYLSLYLGM